ncbi:bifunctional 2-polyprenyl-6-hydroxyphenol methylase/3-demethylubiquinol 3-O-methyltransferase UbiG [Agreia sp. COWG]|uniref:class I SAM-dependent methyltransferase n=1 Tax=Agreia sp. COWG TaxID=2773266 RepID=UPI001927B655|nr:class I SAM-dependent methyltransferase [Agreia sp. COWG]CAD6006933.1 Methyltransferase domain-containing protein [Agreia sp. COWG]
MTLLQPRRTAATRAPATTFGLGGGEPYARALRHGAAGASGRLVLHEVGPSGSSPRVVMDFEKWNASADDVDRALLENARGPVLDIGCGPARMVKAADELGLAALGVDASPEAVSHARASGLTVIEASVFDALPGEGLWQTALLVDGNVGIGGDIGALLERCARLLSPGGELIVELDVDDLCDRSYTATLIDGDGARSDSFPWAETGLDHLLDLADRAGLTPVAVWSAGERRFCRLERA